MATTFSDLNLDFNVLELGCYIIYLSDVLCAQLTSELFAIANKKPS